MAVKGDETRARIIAAARTLVEAQGSHGTGLNEVLAVAGAPRGSLYHHFPGGKDQLVGEALTAAGREVDAMIAGLADTVPDVRELVPALLDALADRMVAADYAKGCPVATVALEVASSNEHLQRICGGIYEGWQRRLADALRAGGHEAADDLAATVLALVEGSLVLARAGRSRLPVERARRQLVRLLA
ncbi:TetR/AcrR family transcriptional regulator [Nonomuraea spiralis]|uniref:TetR/AcrR family transcriptional regulator n=1 Tax=Nonomuraea spiralis TaxID=46182 RepID=A0ABV5IGH0_9ACTN|nr:TetR/AcrR family transcriptional regulator [Nonomuraea spiralis]GGS98740.1 TetR family transcriptional regulator [Nonomuraea spiralis]